MGQMKQLYIEIMGCSPGLQNYVKYLENKINEKEAIIKKAVKSKVDPLIARMILG